MDSAPQHCNVTDFFGAVCVCQYRHKVTSVSALVVMVQCIPSSWTDRFVAMLLHISGPAFLAVHFREDYIHFFCWLDASKWARTVCVRSHRILQAWSYHWRWLWSLHACASCWPLVLDVLEFKQALSLKQALVMFLACFMWHFYNVGVVSCFVQVEELQKHCHVRSSAPTVGVDYDGVCSLRFVCESCQICISFIASYIGFLVYFFFNNSAT